MRLRRNLCFLICLAGAIFASERSISLHAVVEEIDGEAKFLRADSYKIDLQKARIRGDVKNISDIKIGQFAHIRGVLKSDGTVYPSSIKIKKKTPGSSYRGYIEAMSRSEVARIKKSKKLVRDPELVSYVSELGHSLVPEWAKEKWDFEFNVLDEWEVNAFAYPNGKIFVYKGLLGRVENEAQLASILAHEIAHVTQHHGQRNFKSGLWKYIAYVGAAIVVSDELQKQGASRGTAVMTGLALELGFLAAVNGYGRNQEDQADRVGLRYSVSADYDPHEATKVWDLFNAVYGDTPKALNIFYGSHSTNKIRKRNQLDEIGIHYNDLPTLKIEEEDYRARMVDLTLKCAKHDLEKGRYKVAKDEFEKVLQIRPDDEDAKTHLEKTEEKISKKERK